MKAIEDKNKIIESKDAALLSQSSKVIKLATLWEEKSDDSTEAIKKTNELLSSMRDSLIRSGHINP
jgi:hypothetical protein